MSDVKLHKSWLKHLEEEFSQPYMLSLKQFLKEEKAQRKVIYPKGTDIFKALDSTHLDQVKVIILGQDPYHGPDQAHGLSFSVPEGVRLPPSLLNIFKEIQREYGGDIPKNGSLQYLAEQGVLLLNATLTVERAKAGSHQGKGWETFTDKIVDVLNRERDNLVFLLWGAYAQKKGALIDGKKHLILRSPHPSPLSAHRGFLGNNHFVKTNDWLNEHGLEPIRWQP